MSAPRLPLTLPYRESATYASPLLPATCRIWYALGMVKHIVGAGVAIRGGQA